jgi:hypothetical protein
VKPCNEQILHTEDCTPLDCLTCGHNPAVNAERRLDCKLKTSKTGLRYIPVNLSPDAPVMSGTPKKVIDAFLNSGVDVVKVEPKAGESKAKYFESFSRSVYYMRSCTKVVMKNNGIFLMKEDFK